MYSYTENKYISNDTGSELVDQIMKSFRQNIDKDKNLMTESHSGHLEN